MPHTPIRNVERPTLNSQLSTGRPKGRIVGAIWGQTRSYGDAYHWVLPVGTVTSLSAVSVFYPGGVSRGGRGRSRSGYFSARRSRNRMIVAR